MYLTQNLQDLAGVNKTQRLTREMCRCQRYFERASLASDEFSQRCIASEVVAMFFFEHMQFNTQTEQSKPRL